MTLIIGIADALAILIVVALLISDRREDRRERAERHREAE